MCMTPENGERQPTCEFLKILVSQRPDIRVLLDVGAQMLDLQDYELAKTWLAISTNTSAAIYFNEDDELTVLTRYSRAMATCSFYYRRHSRSSWTNASYTWMMLIRVGLTSNFQADSALPLR